MSNVNNHDASTEDVACITLAEALGYQFVQVDYGERGGASWYWVHSGDLRIAEISRPTKADAARAALNLSGEAYDL